MRLVGRAQDGRPSIALPHRALAIGPRVGGRDMTITPALGPAPVQHRRSAARCAADAQDLRHDWTRYAACRDSDPDRLFVSGAAQHEAKLVCKACPVRAQCLADALDNRVEIGMW